MTDGVLVTSVMGARVPAYTSLTGALRPFHQKSLTAQGTSRNGSICKGSEVPKTKLVDSKRAKEPSNEPEAKATERHGTEHFIGKGTQRGRGPGRPTLKFSNSRLCFQLNSGQQMQTPCEYCWAPALARATQTFHHQQPKRTTEPQPAPLPGLHPCQGQEDRRGRDRQTERDRETQRQ
jgi:hypothetical protein